MLYDLSNTVWEEHTYYPTPFNTQTACLFDVTYIIYNDVYNQSFEKIGLQNTNNGWCIVGVIEGESNYVELYNFSLGDWVETEYAPEWFEFGDTGDDLANPDLVNFMTKCVHYVLLSSLAGTDWQFDNTNIESLYNGLDWWIDFEFESNNNTYYHFQLTSVNVNNLEILYYDDSWDGTTVYSANNGWANNNYKSLHFIEDPNDMALTCLLASCATFIGFPPKPDVLINYSGNEIASLSQTGRKTLLTSYKYCFDNVEVVYTKSGITPTGSITLSSNGTFDVTNYASAVVALPDGNEVHY